MHCILTNNFDEKGSFLASFSFPSFVFPFSMPSLATGPECIAKGLQYNFLLRDVSKEKQSKFLPHFIFNLLHKDSPKSLSSALIICLLTCARMPQITVSNQIKILSPPWKRGAGMPLVI